MQFASISDSCATYECQTSDADDYEDYDYNYEDEDEDQTSNSKEVEEGYKKVFHICVCPKKEALKEDIKTEFQKYPKVKQCCAETYITFLDDTNDKKTKLDCPGDQPNQLNQTLRTCKGDFDKESWHPHMFNDTHFHLEEKYLEFESEQFCIGPAFKEGFNSEPDLIQHTLFHCPGCPKGKSCIR